MYYIEASIFPITTLGAAMMVGCFTD